MSRLFRYSRFILACALLALLVACVPVQQPATPSAQDVEEQVATVVAMTVEAQGQIATSVALTVEAQNAETLAAQPTPTEIPPTLPPPTETPIVLPTATPFPVAPTSSGSTGGNASFTPEYSCLALRQPADNTVFRKGNEFDIKWTLTNNGTKTWPAGLDLVYSSGPDLTKNAVTFVELPQVKVGESFTVILDAKVHTNLKPGTNTMVWKLQGGFCFPYISIFVE